MVTAIMKIAYIICVMVCLVHCIKCSFLFYRNKDCLKGIETIMWLILLFGNLILGRWA